MENYPRAIAPQGLKNLKKYKYSAIDKSPVSKYILQPYWTYVATLFPIWMAPNLITLLGFLLVCFNFAILMYYSPGLDVAGPNWIYFSFAIGLWMYSTFDNVDGKQARRTNSSSPLGEIFDHGIDALNCTTGAFLQAGAMLAGPGLPSFILVGLTNVIFYVQTWETYYTGTLYLTEVNGPTEGLIASCFTISLSGIYGPLIWKTKVGTVFSTPFEWINELECSIFFLVGFSVFSVFTQVPPCIDRCLKACDQKGIPRMTALKNLVPFVGLCFVTTLWAFAPSSTLIPNNTVLILLAAGLACGRINAMLVLQHVTHMEYPDYIYLIHPFALGAFLTTLPQTMNFQIFSERSERLYLIFVLAYVCLDYCFWAYVVVEQLCTHLGIKCFTIPYPGDGRSINIAKASGKPLEDDSEVEMEAEIVDEPKVEVKKRRAKPLPKSPVVKKGGVRRK